MKLYVIGRLTDQRVGQVMRDLEDRGHEITFDWNAAADDYFGSRPYTANVASWRPLAEIELSAIQEAEAVVLVDAHGLKGAMFELGYALANGKPVFAWLDTEDPKTDCLFLTLGEVRIFLRQDDLYAALDAGS